MTTTTLDRTKYLYPEERRGLMAMLADEAILARAKGHKLPIRDEMAIKLCFMGGVRASETVALDIRDVLLVHGRPPRLVVRHGKGDKRREVPLPKALKKPLEEYLAWLERAGFRTDPEAPLFPSRAGGRMTRSALWRRWAAALERAGLEHRPLHSTRHTCGVTVYRSSKDLLLVQRLLGHARPGTTAIYASVLDEDVQAAQDAAWDDGEGEDREARRCPP